MADKKNLCAQIDTALHARVRQEQEQSGKTLSEFVEQLITDYYKMKEGTKMTGDSLASSSLRRSFCSTSRRYLSFCGAFSSLISNLQSVAPFLSAKKALVIGS